MKKQRLEESMMKKKEKKMEMEMGMKIERGSDDVDDDGDNRWQKRKIEHGKSPQQPNRRGATRWSRCKAVRFHDRISGVQQKEKEKESHQESETGCHCESETGFGVASHERTPRPALWPFPARSP